MKKILIVLFQGVELQELAPFVDIFGWNNTLNKNRILVETIGDFKEINCCWNLKISPETVFDTGSTIDLKDYSAIVFPGGFGSKGYFDAFKNSNFILFLKNYLQTNYDTNSDFNKNFSDEKLELPYFIGICTGAFVLKELGLLKNRRATTYLRENERYFKQLFCDDITPTRERVVIDKNIITSSGPSTATEVAFYLLERLTNRENSNLIKEEMGFDI